MTGVVSYPSGPRVYFLGRRVHHGSAALTVALAAAILRRMRLATAALLVVAHDIDDFPWRDCDNH
jgi:hypothetical protein